MAQDVVTEKYRSYEALARLGGERFHPDTRTAAEVPV
jgi:hypothetical protein